MYKLRKGNKMYSKLIKKLIAMGYTDMNEINQAVVKYLRTGKLVKPTKGKV
jgi:hypothetical protein